MPYIDASICTEELFAGAKSPGGPCALLFDVCYYFVVGGIDLCPLRYVMRG